MVNYLEKYLLTISASRITYLQAYANTVIPRFDNPSWELNDRYIWLGLFVNAFYINEQEHAKIKFGELDYSSDEMMNVDVTLAYDNALLTVRRGQHQGQHPTWYLS